MTTVWEENVIFIIIIIKLDITLYQNGLKVNVAGKGAS